MLKHTNTKIAMVSWLLIDLITGYLTSMMYRALTLQVLCRCIRRMQQSREKSGCGSTSTISSESVRLDGFSLGFLYI